MIEIGTARSRPYRIAVVGAGPAGFYTAGALLDRLGENVSIDIIERLLAPYGLVRYGVAPDHPNIKAVTRVYEKVALNERVRFLGNVTVGTDVPVRDLGTFYDVVVYAVGAQTDRVLGIPGEEFQGSIASTAFVSWYNAHPDFAEFALSLDHERVAVVGIGNVAIDVARILARSSSELARTDIADPALEKLRHSTVRDIYVIARRGPVQAKCTPAELKELGAIEGVDVAVDARDLELDERAEQTLKRNPTATKNMALFRSFAEAPREGSRCIHFKFFTSPIEVLGEHGVATGLRLGRNALTYDEAGSTSVTPTGIEETLDVSLIIRAIGYRSVPIDGIPFDAARGLVPNAEGRVLDPASGSVQEREYVVGWVKRGPRGLIGSNKADAAETVARIEEDLASIGLRADVMAELDAFPAYLSARGARYIEFDHWQLLDRLELARGAAEGRPRVKFVRTEDMIQHLDKSGESEV